MRTKAIQVKCQNNLRVWGLAILNYSQENDGLVQYNKWNSIASDANYYNPYFGTEAVNAGGHGSKVPQEYFRWCPSQKWVGTGNAPTGYAMNRPQMLNGSTYVTVPSAYNLRQCRSPSTMLFLIDAASSPNSTVASPADLTTLVKPICLPTPANTVRHGGQVNALFADGHVSSYTWAAIDQDTPEETAMVTSWFRLH